MPPLLSLPRCLIAVVLICGLLWTLVLNGAIPFFGTPTLGQAASMMGYAQSFAEQHWFSIHARSFGYPVPTALATGLPLAGVAGYFIRLGLQSADAYSAAVALWLVVAYLGAYRLAWMLGARSFLPAFAAATWMSLPMVWAHQGYSSLGLGMAMLPLYFSSALAVLDASQLSRRQAIFRALEFIVLCVVALFMDGYTFMMFAIVVAITLIFSLFRQRAAPGDLLRVALPVYVAGFALAYALYTLYMGRSAFEVAPLDFFRGWALDLAFLGRPSTGDLWFWDWIGLSQPRSEVHFFGDASVWTTTFGLPLCVAGLLSWLCLRKADARALLLLLVALFGLYMALGPTLKINAMKPVATLDQLMPRSAGVIPTGNAVLSTHVPGFRNMRAAYRWEALFLLGMWGLVALQAARTPQPQRWRWIVGYLALIGLSAPNLHDLWRDYSSYRRGFEQIDQQLAVPLAAKLSPGSRIFLMPYNNDVMANYLSPKLKVVSYNVGGDKQIEIAHDQWPDFLRQFSMNSFSKADLPALRMALVDAEVDAIVIPYFNSLWAAHMWPCAAEASGYSAKTLAQFAALPDFRCPVQIKAAYADQVAGLKQDELLTVDEQPLFAVVKLRPAFADGKGRKVAKARLLSGVKFPIDIAKDVETANRVLGKGWYQAEPVNRWSAGSAEITLPIPEACQQGGCHAELRFSPLAATPARPVVVSGDACTDDAPAEISHTTITLQDSQQRVMSLPVPTGHAVCSLRIQVPNAISPAALGINSDSRVLGISLLGIDIRH